MEHLHFHVHPVPAQAEASPSPSQPQASGESTPPDQEFTHEVAHVLPFAHGAAPFDPEGEEKPVFSLKKNLDFTMLFCKDRVEKVDGFHLHKAAVFTFLGKRVMQGDMVLMHLSNSDTVALIFTSSVDTANLEIFNAFQATFTIKGVTAAQNGRPLSRQINVKLPELPMDEEIVPAVVTQSDTLDPFFTISEILSRLQYSPLPLAPQAHSLDCTYQSMIADPFCIPFEALITIKVEVSVDFYLDTTSVGINYFFSRQRLDFDRMGFRLLTNGHFYDMVIKTRKHWIHAHRAVLASQSDALDALIRAGTSFGGYLIKIDLPAYSFSTLSMLMVYLYSKATYAIVHDPEMTINLFEVACVFGIAKLRDLCITELVVKPNSIVCNKTAIKMLKVGHTHDSEVLVCKAVNIFKSKGTLLRHDPRFHQFLKHEPHLGADLLMRLGRP